MHITNNPNCNEDSLIYNEYNLKCNEFNPNINLNVINRFLNDP
jgi:hypothetical protein